MKINNFEITIKGITPLIMHNGAGASPTDPRELPGFLKKEMGCGTFLEATKNLSKKRGKSEEDHAKLAKLGFYSSLYLNAVGKIIYPSKCLEKMIHEQSKETKQGRVVQRGVIVPEDALLDFPNKNKSLEELYSLHRYDELVKVSQATTPRTRAIFPEWSCTFKVELVAKVIDLATLKDILELGRVYGSLERRPKFGRYELVEVKEI